jgi:UDP-N-acetylmuramoyl-tripeptide--D-alanyl-D-alanine ligase
MKANTVSIDDLYARYLKHPNVVTDSRSIGPGSIFFALRGERYDGNKYVEQALGNGAVYAVVDDPAVCNDHRCILVSDVLATLQELAILRRKTITARVIGITGSNGKTTTKELMAAVLSKRYRTYATQGNLNNHIGVPLTLLGAPADTEILIVEMGANHIGEIGDLCRIAQPDTGLITNIGKAHLEGFGSYQGVITAKGELYRYLGGKGGTTILCHHDDELLMGLAAKEPVEVITYGKSDKAHVRGSIVTDSMHLDLTWIDPLPPRNIETRLIGEYNFPNAMAAIAAGKLTGVDDDLIVSALEEYSPANHRSQWVKTADNSLVVDCYNANPSSMKEAIAHFVRFASEKRWLILGDMLELGEYAEEEHREIALMASRTGSALLFVGGHFSRAGKDLADHIFQNTDELNRWLVHHKPRNRHILLKGSRGIGLEKAIPYL